MCRKSGNAATRSDSLAYGSALSEAPGCAGQNIYVVGGANSAGQAAVYFAKYAKSVTMLIRAPSLVASMSFYLIQQIEAIPNITVRTCTEIVSGHGTDHLESVTLVDLDPAMTRLAGTFPLLRELNHHSLHSPRVHVTNEDAYTWLAGDHGRFDVAIVDFPDPNNFALGKLYTTHFYRMLRRALAPGAPVAIQGTSPLMARSSYWCVAQTLEAAGFADQDLAGCHVPGLQVAFPVAVEAAGGDEGQVE